MTVGQIAYVLPQNVFLVTSAKAKDYVFTSVCLFDWPLDYSKSYERILMKLFGRVGRGQKKNQLDFGGDSDHDTDAGFLLWSL